MSAVARATSRPAASLRASVPLRASPVARPVRALRSRAQRLVVRAEETSSSIDTEKLVADLKEKWDKIENKPQVLLYSVGAIFGLWLTSSILSAVDRVPLIPKAFELVGLSYSAWFTYRYLLFKSSREELIKDVESLKEKITGTGSE